MCYAGMPRIVEIAFSLLTSEYDLKFDLSEKLTNVVCKLFLNSFQTFFLLSLLRPSGAEFARADEGEEYPPRREISAPVGFSWIAGKPQHAASRKPT